MRDAERPLCSSADLLLRANRSDGSNPELRQLTRKERVLRKLSDKFVKLGARYFWLVFAQGRQHQQNLRKRPQVVAMIGCDLQLLDA